MAHLKCLIPSLYLDIYQELRDLSKLITIANMKKNLRFGNTVEVNITANSHGKEIKRMFIEKGLRLRFN